MRLFGTPLWGGRKSCRCVRKLGLPALFKKLKAQVIWLKAKDCRVLECNIEL
jgi:hypothetical protein